MGGQSIFYVNNINSHFLFAKLFTRCGWVVIKGQNSIYVVVEWPLSQLGQHMQNQLGCLPGGIYAPFNRIFIKPFSGPPNNALMLCDGPIN